MSDQFRGPIRGMPNVLVMPENRYTKRPSIAKAEAKAALQNVGCTYAEAKEIVAELKAKGRIWWCERKDS